ncbi:BTB/POZ domain-containing protein-like protein [Tanacetum coccineum]
MHGYSSIPRSRSLADDERRDVSLLLSSLDCKDQVQTKFERVSVDITPGVDESNNNEDVLLKLLHIILEGKDEKARREMKVLVAKMLRENSSHNDLKKDSLYSACDKCLVLLKKHFLKASNKDLLEATQITRQADNLHFLLDILIDRQISEDFLKSWASLTELSEVHSKVPPLHRYEISRVTSRLLLRASRGLDRHLIEDGLGNTILTLPLSWQQEILMMVSKSEKSATIRLQMKVSSIHEIKIEYNHCFCLWKVLSSQLRPLIIEEWEMEGNGYS